MGKEDGNNTSIPTPQQCREKPPLALPELLGISQEFLRSGMVWAEAGGGKDEIHGRLWKFQEMQKLTPTSTKTPREPQQFVNHPLRARSTARGWEFSTGRCGTVCRE